MPTTEDTNGAFEQVVRERVEALKRICRFDELCARLIPCEARDGYLMSVCDLHRDDARLIGWLAEWRAANAFAFPTQFPVTHGGTSTWLNKGVLDKADRILFLVLDRYGPPVGHVGLTGFLNDRAEMEAENIVRGVRNCAPGLMSRAMRALLDWGRGLGAKRFQVRGFRDNEHAVRFYRRLGFHDDEVLPLRKHREGETIVYSPVTEDDTSAPDRYFLRMVRIEP